MAYGEFDGSPDTIAIHTIDAEQGRADVAAECIGDVGWGSDRGDALVSLGYRTLKTPIEDADDGDATDRALHREFREVAELLADLKGEERVGDAEGLAVVQTAKAHAAHDIARRSQSTGCSDVNARTDRLEEFQLGIER